MRGVGGTRCPALAPPLDLPGDVALARRHGCRRAGRRSHLRVSKRSSLAVQPKAGCQSAWLHHHGIARERSGSPITSVSGPEPAITSVRCPPGSGPPSDVAVAVDARASYVLAVVTVAASRYALVRASRRSSEISRAALPCLSSLPSAASTAGSAEGARRSKALLQNCTYADLMSL